VRALASRFPATEKIVGEEFFVAMARAFIGQHPPRSPLLLDYGDELADFVQTFEPTAELAYLPDVVRLETARSRAYHAADAAPIDPAVLPGFDGERLAALTVEVHPSASIVRSDHPVVTIWAMNAGESPLRPIETWSGEDALVVRPRLTVLVHRLPAGGAAFLAALFSGMPLGAAVETALAAEPGFDLTANLAGILQAGALTAVH
jgi:hypothetical protein